jgi:hypothetical protein
VATASASAQGQPPAQPAACQSAMRMKALGRMDEYQTFAAQCRAQGGVL